MGLELTGESWDVFAAVFGYDASNVLNWQFEPA